MSRKFIVIGSRDKGLFSNFLHTLQYLNVSDVDKRIPIVNWKICYYLSDLSYNGGIGNVWDYYFEPVSEYKISDITKEDDVIECSGKVLNAGIFHSWKGLKNPGDWSRGRVYGVLLKHIRIKSIIMDKINNFYELNMKDQHILGVHLRGCSDHKGGARDINLPNRIKQAQGYASANNVHKIFVATDYEPYLDIMKKEFGDMIISYSCSRSTTGFNVVSGGHAFLEMNGKYGGPVPGEEGIVECLLLSKCNYLQHSRSNLTTCALYFNSTMPHKYFEAPPF